MPEEDPYDLLRRDTVLDVTPGFKRSLVELDAVPDPTTHIRPDADAMLRVGEGLLKPIEEDLNALMGDGVWFIVPQPKREQDGPARRFYRKALGA